MYLRWTTYKCPSCGARTESRIVSSPRVGVEYKKCRSCGFAYRTPDIEWRHMTRGQRVGYFLNEWAVAVLGLSVVFAGVALFAEPSDWRVSLIIVAVGAACCTPFWIIKYFAVQRSIRRASESGSTQHFGDIQGLDNISHAGTISADTTPYVPPAEAPKKSGMRIMWKIRLAIVGMAVIFGVLDSQWKTIDRYFPALNKLLHAGTPSSEGDMDYLFEHMHDDEKKISSGCGEKMEFKECRLGLLATRPALADLHERLDALTSAWVKEKSERQVPATCTTKMDGFLSAYTRYLAAEDKMFAVMETMDSPEHIKDKSAIFQEASGQEDIAVDALHKAGVGNACEGY